MDHIRPRFGDIRFRAAAGVKVGIPGLLYENLRTGIPSFGYPEEVGVARIVIGGVNRHTVAHDERIHHALCDAEAAVCRGGEFHYRICQPGRSTVVPPEHDFRVLVHVRGPEHVEIRV